MEKSEFISHNQTSADSPMSSFPDLSFVNPSQATLLGSPLGDANSVNECLQNKTNQLKLIGERLCHLQSHDAIVLLRHSFAIPKLLHILRTSPAFLSPTIQSFDNQMLSTVSHITNINFHSEDSAWLHKPLSPVGSGGLGIRSAAHLAPSAFLASADGASVLMQQLLPPHLSTITYKERDLALSNWREGLPSDTPQPDMGISHVQKSWDQPRVQFQQEFLLSNCNDPQSRARLLAASSK